jgi:segregation and condensation protein B
MPSAAKRHLKLAEVAEDEVESMSETRPEELRLLEALLFAAGAPLDEKTLAARLPQGVDVKAALQKLQAEYASRGVNLVRVAGKWSFRTATDLAWLLSKESVVPRKLSRAAIETLAIVAYHQPVSSSTSSVPLAAEMPRMSSTSARVTGW